MNVERPFDVPLALVVEACARHAPSPAPSWSGSPRAPLSEGFPQDIPIPGFDPASPRDRERTRLLVVAQTRRKRQTKHRGNAAGLVESRGRTGRKPTAAEKSGTRARRPARRDAIDKRDRPPTWRGAFLKAMFAAVGLLLCRDPSAPSIQPGDRPVSRRARGIHAVSYYTDTGSTTAAAQESQAGRGRKAASR